MILFPAHCRWTFLVERELLCHQIFLLLIFSQVLSAWSGMKVTADFTLVEENSRTSYLTPPKLLFRRFNNSAIAYLYVAAVNTILQLDQQSLQLTEKRVTGPKNFSVFRFPSLCSAYPHHSVPSLPPGYSPDNCGPRPTDVYVKAWATASFTQKLTEAYSFNEISRYDALYPLNDDFQAMEDTLYTCYNIFHGSCEGMQLTNISITKTWNRRPSDSNFFHREFSPSIPIPVVNWNAALSATIVLDRSFMYVGQEPDKIQEMTFVDIAPLAVRLRDFDYVSKQPNPESTLKLRVSDFPIQYKFSFQYTHIRVSDAVKGIGDLINQPKIYFVLQQPDNSEPKQWKTRISRICSEDTRFDSYTEITMACDGCITGQKIFNALHMATRGTLGTIVAGERQSLVEKSTEAAQWSRQKRNPEDFSNVLLVAFAAQPVDRLVHPLSGNFFTQEHEFVPYLMRGTAISLYTMAEVDIRFDLVVSNCLSGIGRMRPNHFVGDEIPRKCARDPSLLLRLKYDGYCPNHRPLNWPISGSERSERLVAPAIIILEENVTGMAITRVSDNFTVLVVTTDEGFLTKYEVESGNRTRRLSAVRLTRRRKPLRGLTLDDSGLVAFAVSDDKVYRVELQDCASHRSCAACLAARDPYCGWCVSKGQCSPKSYCHSPDVRGLNGLKLGAALPPSQPSPNLWLSYLNKPDLCPVIAHVSPSGVESPTAAYRMRIGSSKDPLEAARYRPNPLILQLSRLLADSLTLALRGPNKHRLLCSFRPAPASLHPLAKYWAASGEYVISEELKVALRHIVPGQVIEQTDASLLLNSDEVQCSSPDPTRLPPLPDDEPSLQMVISLEMTTSSAWAHHSQSGEHHPRKSFTEVQSLASGLFSVYDCSRFKDCRSCSRSRFGCLWCLSEERCLSVTEIQYGVSCPDLPNHPSAVDRQSTCSLVQTGSGCSCPSFVIESSNLSAASLAAFSIAAHISHLKAPATRFVCSEGCSGDRVVGIYDPGNSTVTCQFSGVDFSKVILATNLSNVPEPGTWQPNLDAGVSYGIVKCPIGLHWFNDRDRHGPSTGHPLANKKTSALEIFETSRMAQHCDSCLALPARFNAGWCLPNRLSSAGSCVTQAKCMRHALPDTQWLQSPDTCPDPQIISVSPENATFDGRMTLLVRGVNFGPDLEKLILSIVGDAEVACRTSSVGFLPSRQFQCRLAEVPSNTKTFLAARVKLTVVGVSSQVSSVPFHFLTPSVTGFVPSRGPIAGGTRISIHGSNLNVGGDVSVFLILDTPNKQAKTNCSIELLTSELLICTTVGIQFAMSSREISDMEGLGVKSTLFLQHAATLTEFVEHEFSFSPNPVIRRVPTSSVLLGGGTLIHVFGEFLDVIVNPLVVFYYKGWEYTSTCQFTQGHLCCASPALQIPENSSVVHRTLRSATDVSSPFPAQWAAVEDLRTKNDSAFTTTVLRSGRLPFLESRFVAVGIDFDDTDFTDVSSPLPPPITSRLTVPYGFVLDNVTSTLVVGTLEVLPNPRVLPFPDGLRIEPFASTLDEDLADSAGLPHTALSNSSLGTPSRDHHLLRLHGHFESLLEAPTLQSPEELSVRIGDSHECHVTTVTAEELRCDLSRQGLQEDEEYEVKIRFGQYLEARPGRIQFKQISTFGDRGKMGIIVGSVLVVVFILLSFVIFVIWCRFHRLQQNLEVKFQQRWAEQEKCVARASKQDFMELQTHMVEVAQDLNKSSLPFRDYQTYCLFSLFPDYHNELQRPGGLQYGTGISVTRTLQDALSNGVPADMTAAFANPTLGHPVFSSFRVPRDIHVDASRGIQLLQSLLFNKHFIFVFVRAIEDDERISARDKSHVASLLSIILQSDMVYLTSIIFILISDLLQRCHSYGGDSRLLTAFRRSESVVAKMLSNWLTFLLFNFIKEQIGGQLFFLYRALLQQLNTGPQDVVTGNARYTLDTGTLLKTDFLSPQIVLLVTDPEGLFNFGQDKLSVKVLLCDTITQAKAKILDAIYRNVPYSQQIKPQEVQLGKLSETNGSCSPPSYNIACVMTDYDIKIRRDARLAASQGPPYPLNCLHDYGLTNNDIVALIRPNGHTIISMQPSHESTAGRNTLKNHLRHQSPSFETGPCSPFVPPVLPCPPSTATLINPSIGAPINGGMSFVTETPSCCLMGLSDSPDPHMWYHLEKPTSCDTKNTGTGHKQSVSHRTFDSRKRSKDACASSTSPAVYDDGYSRKPNCYCCARVPASQTWRRQDHLSGLDSGLPGVDAASLRRWLEADVSSLGDSFVNSSGRRRRMRRRKCRHHSVGSSNRNDLLLSPDGQLESALVDRPMTRLPCEVLLNRLLKTRMSVLQYMDNVVELIFGVQSSGPPACIRFLFDFLDKQAVHLGIRDPDIVHAWKSNCLHLRFWNQILTNLDYIFDIPLARNTALESSFLSFSQAITYACSPVLDKITKDSPFNKVLFAADIQRNWSRVKAYYEAIKNQSPLSEVEMNSLLLSHSEEHHNDFNVDWALYELYVRHLSRCSDKISSALAAAATNHEGSPLVRPPADDFSAYAFPDAFVYDGDATSEWAPLNLLSSLEEMRRSFHLVVPNGTSCGGACDMDDGGVLCLSTSHLDGCCGSDVALAPTHSPAVPEGYQNNCLQSSALQPLTYSVSLRVGATTEMNRRPPIVPLERRELPPIPVTSLDEDLTHRTLHTQVPLTPAAAAATTFDGLRHSTATQFAPVHRDLNPFRNKDLSQCRENGKMRAYSPV